MAEKKKMTMGLIVGNRGFFPDHLAKSGREEMLRVLQAAGMEVVALTAQESKYGAVETREESRRWAELYEAQEKQERQESDPERSGFTATSRENGCVKSGNVPYHE
jgi:L-fucose isomerase-like protein